MFGAGSSSSTAGAEQLNHKKISIIIPCYNSEQYIEECFESIKNQTIGIENIQVVFVNDASTDNTLQYLKEQEQKFPNFVNVINLEENLRQGGARNRGLSYSVGEYIMFLDSDDWLGVDSCEKIYEKAKEYDIDILQFPFIHVYSNHNCYKEEYAKYGFLDGTLSEIKRSMLIGTLFNFGSQNKLYRRAFLKMQGATFPEGVVYEEPYFVYPLLLEAQRFYIMEEGMYYYRQMGQSVTSKHMEKDTTLYNHPYVQLELLKKLLSNKKYIKDYYNEIEFHFLHSYYIETLYFAGVGKKYLQADYFRNMQRIVLELFPLYKENPYLLMEEFYKLREILHSLHRNFTQDELETFCVQVANILSGDSI